MTVTITTHKNLFSTDFFFQRKGSILFLMYSITTSTKKITKLKKRIRAVQGGTSAGKSISILLYLIARAQTDTKPTLTSIVSESFPHLKRGVMRDFLMIMGEHGYYKEERWNRTDFTYEFETGSKIEFFSADQPDKVRGPRRERLFMNECNNMALETFEQLEIRTKEFIFLDWNPTFEFWFYTDVVTKRDDVEHIIVTYRDNEALSIDIVRSIEQRKNRKQWWLVYGEGQLGDFDEKIYTGWNIIEEIPHEAKLVRYGLDFGFTNDPTAIVALYSYNGGLILDEVIYQTRLTNNQIADIFAEKERAVIIADSSEPKSINDLVLRGLTCIGVEKNRGTSKDKTFLRWSIEKVQEEKISVTKNSVNLISEYRKYMWAVDKDGKVLNLPETGADHALDATRYCIISYVAKRDMNSEPQKSYSKPLTYGRNKINFNKFS